MSGADTLHSLSGQQLARMPLKLWVVFAIFAIDLLIARGQLFVPIAQPISGVGSLPIQQHQQTVGLPPAKDLLVSLLESTLNCSTGTNDVSAIVLFYLFFQGGGLKWRQENL